MGLIVTVGIMKPNKFAVSKNKNKSKYHIGIQEYQKVSILSKINIPKPEDYRFFSHS